METHSKTGKGIGARLLRKEDDRYMRGRGEFVADIRLAGMKDVAFLRSPLAHARLHGINVPERLRDRVFTHDDMTGVRAIRAVTGLPGFKVSEQPPLATGKVRHVGELVAMCLGETRAEAEDVAAEVDMNLVMNANGEFIELQGTGEKNSFTEAELTTMLAHGRKGVTELLELQKAAIAEG